MTALLPCCLTASGTIWIASSSPLSSRLFSFSISLLHSEFNSIHSSLFFISFACNRPGECSLPFDSLYCAALAVSACLSACPFFLCLFFVPVSFKNCFNTSILASLSLLTLILLDSFLSRGLSSCLSSSPPLRQSHCGAGSLCVC